MKYQGSCHCQQIRYEVEGEISKLMQCNCSICQKRGALHWFVGKEQFTLLTDPSQLATYTFNKHVISHQFCPQCGCAPFSEGQAPSGNYMVAINARCLDELDINAFELGHFDGRSL